MKRPVALAATAQARSLADQAGAHHGALRVLVVAKGTPRDIVSRIRQEIPR